MALTIRQSTRFRRDVKRLRRQGLDLAQLETVTGYSFIELKIMNCNLPEREATPNYSVKLITGLFLSHLPELTTDH